MENSKSNKQFIMQRFVINFFMPLVIVITIILSLYGMLFEDNLPLDIRKICGAIVLNAFVLSIVLISKLKVNTKEITIVEPANGGSNE